MFWMPFNCSGSHNIVCYYQLLCFECDIQIPNSFTISDCVNGSYAECTALFQLIKLLNTMRNDPFDIIFEAIEQKNHTYCQLSNNITNRYLNAYDPNCRIVVMFNFYMLDRLMI